MFENLNFYIDFEFEMCFEKLRITHYEIKPIQLSLKQPHPQA
jgi:hypothetical protein